MWIENEWYYRNLDSASKIYCGRGEVIVHWNDGAISRHYDEMGKAIQSYLLSKMLRNSEFYRSTQ